jgi:predicted component of type VI protein secretion system
MVKITLSTDSGVLKKEVELAKERLKIGRAPHNDLVIDDLAVSAEHAVIVTIMDDSFLEDLNSTNGTQVNGQPIRKHFLRDGDVIELAQYRIRYITTESRAQNRRDAGRTALSDFAKASKGVASIRILDGPNAGRETVLAKVINTIGHSGKQVAVIVSYSHSYCLTQIEKNESLLVNDKPVDMGALCRMTHGDLIDLAGVKMVFLLSGNPIQFR